MTDLRPYRDPDAFHNYTAVYRPGIGVLDEQGQTIASKISRSSAFKRSVPGTVFRQQVKPVVNYDNMQKQYTDLEFVEYFDFANVGELIKSLVQSLMRNYAKIVIAQPFEVSRLLLQVGDIHTISGELDRPFNSSFDGHDEDDDDDDEIDYFQPKDEERKRTRALKRKTKSTSVVPTSPKPPSRYLTPMSLKTVDVMSATLGQEGMRGLWRATNTTFIYNTLSATLEAWITGFVSAFLHIPDPFFVEVAHSPEPTTTLMLSLGASVLTGLILAPLDIIRTRMIVTKLEGSQRSLRDSIKRLKFMTCPLSLIIPTILNSLANNLFKKLTPYLLLVKFGIDSTTSPSLYGTISLISSILVLAVKLPIETLLRRAQVSYMLKRAHGSFNSLKITDDKAMVVKFAGYSGIFTTLWDILYFRGENGGVEAVFRGWRVGVLNVFGSWGLELLQNNYDDQISMEEKF